jgi:hypothetical protein
MSKMKKLMKRYKNTFKESSRHSGAEKQNDRNDKKLPPKFSKSSPVLPPFLPKYILYTRLVFSFYL